MTETDRTVQVPVSLPTREEITSIRALRPPYIGGRCDCGHAASSHNALGYCKVFGNRAPAGGDCICANYEDERNAAWRDGRDAVLALLSQPIPTAEPCERCGGTGYQGDGPFSMGVPCPSCTAEPPRIEDMAPGTTFTACWRGHVEPDQFVVLNNGVRCIAPGRWYGGIATETRYASDRIDLSTIRDVTPPAVTE